MPSKKELQTLIKDDDLSIRFVPKKKNAESSECWNSFHHIFVHNVQQQFVSYNTCKELFMYSSLNGTNTLRSQVNPLNVSKKTKTNIIEACTEFCTLNGRAFDVMRGVGFQNLVQILAELLYYSGSMDRNSYCYCGVALRYVTDDFKLFTFILGCFPYNAASHSAQYLREFVNKVLAEYKLVLNTTKFAVTGNEAKISTFEAVGCELAQTVFGHVKKIVFFVRHSHKQQKLPRKLQNYSEARFAGAIIMLDIFREMYQNLPEVLINSNAMENYNAIEKDLLDDICNFLEPFQDVINDLSKDRQPCRHQIASNVLQNNNASHSQTSTTATTPKRKSLLTQCFDSKLTSRPQSSNSYQEIENYLNADYSDIPHNDNDLDDIDILSFWQENRHTFPQLVKLSKIICAIPASNTIVERLFSAAKMLSQTKERVCNLRR
ncbi:unnamed protein product [Rotaria magnacalcarata]|uniref:HAT C-terminal dimerisation domain-containing protein n=2 Tax=Rotaria magnacalcarata TaxID=392030 RepID=A0A820G5L4_9BILA|nr:unnamed protein product [Rotaria magnacalcarata]